MTIFILPFLHYLWPAMFCEGKQSSLIEFMHAYSSATLDLVRSPTSTNFAFAWRITIDQDILAVQDHIFSVARSCCMLTCIYSWCPVVDSHSYEDVHLHDCQIFLSLYMAGLGFSICSCALIYVYRCSQLLTGFLQIFPGVPRCPSIFGSIWG